MAKQTKPVIYIVDDDESVRRAMKRLIRSIGMDVMVFSSAQEFLEFKYRKHNSCMIVDIRLEGKSGLELQDDLRAAGSNLPMIFITGYDTQETRDQAKKSGAVGYFRKPIDDQALLDSIHWALAKQNH
ncbi:MAG: response regulator [Deltaproteobacteria bacterium]|nr:response regulator [Deltaproteobacteria bacterium]MBW2562915.1 response regulator [Deltaproteobacteria bacterium]